MTVREMFVKFGFRVDAKELFVLEKKLALVDRAIGTLHDRLTAPIRYAGAASAALLAMTGHYAGLAVAQTRMAASLGQSSRDFQAYSQGAALAGSSSEAFGDASRKLRDDLVSISRGEGGDAAKNLMILGVRMYEGFQKIPDTIKTMRSIADRLREIEDPAARANMAVRVLGQSGYDLLPFLEGGAQGMDEFVRQAIRMRTVMGDEAIEESRRYGVNIRSLTAWLTGVRTELVSGVLPHLNRLLVFLRTLQVELRPIVEAGIEDLIRMTGVAVRFLVGALNLLVLGLRATRDLLGSNRALLTALKAILVGAWIASVVAALASLAVAFKVVLIAIGATQAGAALLASGGMLQLILTTGTLSQKLAILSAAFRLAGESALVMQIRAFAVIGILLLLSAAMVLLVEDAIGFATGKDSAIGRAIDQLEKMGTVGKVTAAVLRGLFGGQIGHKLYRLIKDDFPRSFEDLQRVVTRVMRAIGGAIAGVGDTIAGLPKQIAGGLAKSMTDGSLAGFVAGATGPAQSAYTPGPEVARQAASYSSRTTQTLGFQGGPISVQAGGAQATPSSIGQAVGDAERNQMEVMMRQASTMLEE